jgi:serine/threonine protein kinase
MVAYVWKIMLEIARGIDFIHGHDQIHRDLKPTNGTCQL